MDALILCQFSYLKFDGIIPGIPENRAGKGFLNKSAEKTGTFQRAGGCEEDASEDPGNPEDPESSEDPENPEDLGNFGEKKTCPW
ncbi:MAG: hypothetical protein LUE16_02395 [Lachnospiraceae bacterium]|nr:hypothetical protein [Lachnospiraceae bacterium]